MRQQSRNSVNSGVPASLQEVFPSAGRAKRSCSRNSPVLLCKDSSRDSSALTEHPELHLSEVSTHLSRNLGERALSSFTEQNLELSMLEKTSKITKAKYFVGLREFHNWGGETLPPGGEGPVWEPGLDQAGLGRTVGTEPRDLITLIPHMISVSSFFLYIQSLEPTLLSSVHHPKASPSPKAHSSPTHQTALCFSPRNITWVNIPCFIPRSAASIHPHHHSNSSTKLLFSG